MPEDAISKDIYSIEDADNLRLHYLTLTKVSDHSSKRCVRHREDFLGNRLQSIKYVLTRIAVPPWPIIVSVSCIIK